MERLDAEAGGHRVQRIPPTEKRGRVHSSTVTVAVMDQNAGAGASPWLQRGKDDFEVSFYSGTGPGGQNRNKVQASCRIRHIPTGVVRSAQTRSRENSQRLAMEALMKDLDHQGHLARGFAENGIRRDQVGTGERSDKRRTFRWQEGMVHDHVTGRSAPIAKVMAGRFDLLWR